MFDPVFEYFSAKIYLVNPQGELTLSRFIQSIKFCKLKKIFDEIKAAEESGNLELKSELKTENLFYVTPCVYFGGDSRSYSSIKNFTGVMVLDFDHLTYSESLKLKEWLFEVYPEVICTFLSPSRHGVKALVRIPVATSVQEFKSYFYGIAAELGEIKGFDGSCQNPSLPLFISLDDEILYRTDATEWNIMGEKEGDFSKTVPVPPPKNFSPLESDKKWIQNWVTKKISNIYDNAHPQLLSIGITLGGYVGYGYLSSFEAEQIIEQCIRSNGYMSKKAGNGQVYVNTSKEMIARGSRKPLSLPWQNTKKLGSK